MPHKRKPRIRSKATDRLLSSDNTVRGNYPFEDRENQVPNMSQTAMHEVRSIIQDRYDAAKQQTDKIAQDMNRQEKQYSSQWNDPAIDANEKIFLPKTRENVQTVYAYIMLLVSQLRPIVTMQPKYSLGMAPEEEYRRAKVAEFMTEYYFSDVWHFRDDILPKWLKHFLKFSMGIWKVTYKDDSFFPDLKLEVVDRALFYIDPTAHDVKDARWAIEKYYIPRSEAIRRVEDGHWKLDEAGHQIIESGFQGVENGVASDVLRRYLGDTYGNRSSVTEDELVEVWDYWQAPHSGLDSVYAVILGGDGGQVVRYGENPFPYKGLPFRAKSFDPHEHRPDGTGMVEQYEPFQKIVNTFLNMRLTDVRKNIIQPVAATGAFIDAQTQEDFKNGQKIVRLSDEVMEASKDPGFDIRKHFVPLPFNTSTGELLTHDLPFILGQGQESSNVSDVFKGQAPAHQATLGQIQEQLSRNQGVFRPIYTQVMRGIEEIAEICMEYFRDPRFYPQNRVIQIVGKNKYEDVIQNWHRIPNTDAQVLSVNADDLDVDVSINAVNGADSLASRTAAMSSFEQLFQGIGQVPGLFETLQGEFNFTEVVGWMLNASGHDIEVIRLSPEQKAQREQQAQQAEQQALQQQAQLQQAQMEAELQMEQAKSQLRIQEEQARAQTQIQLQQVIAQNKAQLDLTKLQLGTEGTRQSELEAITAKITQTLQADLIRMNEEARLESVSGVSSVGHGNEISTPQGEGNADNKDKREKGK